MNQKPPGDPSMASTDEDVQSMADSTPTFVLVRCQNEECGVAALLPEGVAICPACQKGTLAGPFGFYDRRGPPAEDDKVVWQ